MPLCAGCCAGEWRATEAAERNLQPAVEFTCGMPPYAHQGTPAPSTTRQVVDKSGQRYSVLRDSQTKGFWTYPTKFLGFCGTPGARLTDCRQMRRTAARAPHSCLRNRSGPHCDVFGKFGIFRPTSTFGGMPTSSPLCSLCGRARLVHR